ncbi:MAG: hypothetical protein ETSY1_14030 [Candidatus Entotheonella factor]|uniref:Putative restriction endonuclease domain-containing protein n=2 Tax=Candidatus Entotheonella TaxID=93171 RepID=W4LNN9_ENTF1|nr:MAG: hypothetical protein ETSY1_14030 [Candidatus Entotheonella factor]
MVQSASSSQDAINYWNAIDKIDYPSSDGLPMAESDFQRKYLTYAVEGLDVYFRDRDDVYVSGNMFIYYEQGNRKAVVAPDVFVVMGTGKHNRDSYLLWQEPKGPDFVMEITSRSTRSEDQGPKRGTYAFLGVQEYWQYDPTGDYLEPQLQGFRLVGRNYEPIPEPPRTDGGLTFHSTVLNLQLRLESSGELRFYDPQTSQPLQWLEEATRARDEAERARDEAEQARDEAEQARQQAEAQAQREAAARQAAEARIAELEARLRAQENE